MGCSFESKKVITNTNAFQSFLDESTKSDLENATGVDTSKFAKNVNLASLKSGTEKLDIDKLAELDADELKPVLVDL